MINYDDIILRLNAELRDEEAWPSDTTKTAEQINLLYMAALAVAREVSLNRLALSESSTLSGTVINGAIKSYALPDDIFDLRWPPRRTETMIFPGDMGISKLRFDGVDKLLQQAIPVQSLFEIANRLLHKSRYLFALDFNGNQIYATNVDDFKLYYVPKPARPTTSNYTTLTWPLQNDSDTQRAVHIVANHVSGVTIKDPAGAQFQSLLSQVYTL